MKLSKINIQNYRGVLEKEEVLLGDFTTLVGKNDAGKSIILHAIDLFLNDDKIYLKDFHNCSEDQEATIACYWSDPDLDEKVNNYLKRGKAKSVGYKTYTSSVIEDDNMLGIRKKYTRAGKKADEAEIRIYDYDKSEFRNLWSQKDSDLTQIIKDLGVEIPKSGEGRNSKAEKIKYIRNFLDDEGEQKKWRWVEDSFDLASLLPAVEFFQCENSIETGTPFRTYLRNEVRELFEAKDKNLKEVESNIKERMNEEGIEIGKYMKKHVSTLEKVAISPVFDWVKGIGDIDVEFKFSDDSDPVPMENKGSGYRRLFMVGRFQYLSRKKDSKNTIYMIEEPETFLHPSAQQNFLESLIALSEDNQIIISSHSPVFAGASNQEYIILAKKEDDDDKTFSTYSQKADEDRNEDFIFSIIKELGIKPSYNLRDSFEKIIFMESHNDIEFLKIAAKKLGFNFDEEDFLFLPGGGGSLSNFVDIKYFSKQGRPLFLIIDSDKSNKTNNQYKKNKQLVEDFSERERSEGWMLHKSEIENYYHPNAIERLYGLEQNSINDGNLFSIEDDVDELLKSYKKSKSVGNIKHKGNSDVFQEMTKEEWEAVSDSKLENILKKVFHDSDDRS